jgi:hypothetical protein
MDAWTPTELSDGYKLRLAFKDDLVGDVDLSYLVGKGPIFEPLRDLEYFRRVRLDRTVGTIVWPNGADVAPETLYAHAPALEDRAPSRGRVPLAYCFVPTMHRATPGTRTLPSFSNALTFAMAVARIRSRAGSSTC